MIIFSQIIDSSIFLKSLVTNSYNSITIIYYCIYIVMKITNQNLIIDSILHFIGFLRIYIYDRINFLNEN